MSQPEKPELMNDIPADASYEDLVQRLETTVERLEAGELSLEAAVQEYERGMHLVERCNQMLDKAELRVTELSTRAGNNQSDD